MFKFFKSDKNKEKANKADNNTNRFSEQIFYGDEAGSLRIIRLLNGILFGGGEESTVDQYSTSYLFYTQVWIRKHGGLDPVYSTTPYIKEAMKERFSDFANDIVEKAVDKCLEYIYIHEPSLNDNVEVAITPLELSNLPYRFVINYQKGVKLFNQKKYSEAINFFRKCVDVKEDDTNARFEIAEAYILMGILDKAEETLIDTVPFISKDTDKARLYRRIGFIRIEKSEYEIATALLLYSWLIEENPKALRELEYIKAVSGCEAKFSRSEVAMLLKENGLLFWSIFDRSMKVSDYYIRTIAPGKTGYDLNDLSKEEIVRLEKFIEIQSRRTPSEVFVSGSLFDIYHLSRKYFEEVICSGDALELRTLFIKMYTMFLEKPQLVGVPPIAVNRNKEDTNPFTWNTDLYNLGNGDYAALLFMPIVNDIYAARIAGIIFSESGDGYYYCMVNKNSEIPSIVNRNMIMFGLETIGEVKGFGLPLMEDFLECIKANFYQKVIGG